MPSIADVYVTVLAETSRVAPEVRKAVKEAGRGLDDIKVNVDADTSKARREADVLKREIEAKHVELKVDVDKSALSQVTSAVTDLTPALSRAGSQAGAATGDALSTAISASLKGGAGIGIAGALGVALIDVGGIAASASQSLLLLPAAAGAAAAGFGTLKLATMGFSDALDSIRDPEKFATALQSLSPNAQQAALAIQALIPAFDGLKNATQDALFTNVGGMLNSLVGQYLPTIQQATTGIATAFNTMLQGVTNQLMTPETQGAIQTFLANVTQAFQNLAPAAAPLTQALSTLMAAGSSVLPAIAQAATSAAEAFSDFITKANASGDLQRWLGEGLSTLKQLGQIAWDVGRAFLAMAPAGQQILPTIVSFVNGLANVMPQIVSTANAVQGSFSTWAPILSPAIGIVEALSGAIGAISGIAASVASAFQSAMNVVASSIDMALGPIREAINIANMVPGINIPQIPSIGPRGAAAVINPTTTTVLGPGQFRRRDGSIGKSGPPPATLPAAAIPAIPAGGYAVPLPPPPKAAKSSAVTPNLPYTGTADPNAGYSSSAYGGYPGDAALLASVSAGQYTQSQRGDLTKGLADCSSAVEDLVNLFQGQSTAGASVSTANEGAFLASRGFVQGMGGPGDFRVGFNDHHTQATLPGGTNFNWGSQAAAQSGGVAPNSGAYDPSFTSHYYLPGGASAMSAAYPSGTSGSGMTSSDLTLRNAQQRVNDTQHSEEQAQGRLNELRAKGTATDRQLEAAEYALAKAKREHTDAIDAQGVAMDKANAKANKSAAGGNSDVAGLGGDLLGGVFEALGFDGTLFKNPADFGLVKILGSLSKVKPSAGTGVGTQSNPFGGLAGDGGGGGGLGSILSMFTGGGGQPGGMPAMPQSGDLMAAPFGAVNPGAAGPGNNGVVQNFNMQGSTYGYDQNAVAGSIQSGQMQAVRQPLRNVP